jgi:hypothetical protein
VLQHDRPHLDRPVALPVAPDALRHPVAELAHQFLLAEQRVGRGNVVRHRRLMLQPVLVDLERRFQREDRLPVLDGDHPAGRERAAVADAVDLVDDRHGCVAGPHEIAMQGMNVAVGFDGALRGDQRLRDGLAPEDALPVRLRGATSKQIVLELLEVENGEKLLHGSRHVFAFQDREDDRVVNGKPPPSQGEAPG